jgi:hypothetical protein
MKNFSETVMNLDRKVDKLIQLRGIVKQLEQELKSINLEKDALNKELIGWTRIQKDQKGEVGDNILVYNSWEERRPSWKDEFIEVLGEEAAKAVIKDTKPTIKERLDILPKVQL